MNYRNAVYESIDKVSKELKQSITVVRVLIRNRESDQFSDEKIILIDLRPPINYRSFEFNYEHEYFIVSVIVSCGYYQDWI